MTRKTAVGIAIGVVTGCLLLGILALAGKGVAPWATANSRSDSVTVRIGEHEFRIPRSYIWIPQQRKDGQRSGVNLEALLPNLEQRSSQNDAEFKIRGHGRTIAILVHENNGRFSSLQTLTHYKKNALGPPLRSPNGFDVYTIKVSNTSTKELLVKKNPDGTHFFLYCTPARAAFSPSCQGVIDHAEDVYIRFTFARDFLSEGEEISQKVRRLLQSFEINRQG